MTTDLLDRLSLDHRNLLRLLEVLEEQLAQVHAGTERDFDLLADLMEYLQCYADQVHHPREEAVFARIRAHTDEGAATLARLEEQHRNLARLNHRFHEMLEAVLHEGVVRRDVFEQQGRVLVQALRGHLDLEDREAFPLARKTLTTADWQAIEAALPGVADPLFEAEDPARFRILYQHLARDLARH